eukprot:786458-Prymnesium_polylepis.1
MAVGTVAASAAATGASGGGRGEDAVASTGPACGGRQRRAVSAAARSATEAYRGVVRRARGLSYRCTAVAAQAAMAGADEASAAASVAAAAGIGACAGGVAGRHGACGAGVCAMAGGLLAPISACARHLRRQRRRAPRAARVARPAAVSHVRRVPYHRLLARHGAPVRAARATRAARAAPIAPVTRTVRVRLLAAPSQLPVHARARASRALNSPRLRAAQREASTCIYMLIFCASKPPPLVTKCSTLRPAPPPVAPPVKLSCKARAQRALTVWGQCLSGAVGSALLRRSEGQFRSFRYQRDRLVEPVHLAPLRGRDAIG